MIVPEISFPSLVDPEVPSLLVHCRSVAHIALCTVRFPNLEFALKREIIEREDNGDSQVRAFKVNTSEVLISMLEMVAFGFGIGLNPWQILYYLGYVAHL